MTIKNTETPFSLTTPGYEPELFEGIRELGFTDRGSFIVDAYTTPADEEGRRGTYFTSLPISDMEYRREYGTRASYGRGDDQLTIRDDWGHRYVFYAPTDIIDALVAECVANNIPEEK